MTQAPLFFLEQYSLSYGECQVLRDISLSIDVGEKVALVGPSGAGKSSLINILYQQQPDDIALCPQALGLVESLSTYHNIYMGQLERHNAFYNIWNLIRPIAAPYTEVKTLADRLGLQNKLSESVAQLSGGQRQRVSIGRALFRQKDIFLGDEPVSSLDPLQGQDILQSILAQHKTAVVALHNRRIALNVFDRVIGIKQGEIAFDCAASELSLPELDAFYAQE